MSSITPIRDPKSDHLISPENSALILIDYQPLQVNSVNSMDHKELVENIGETGRFLWKLYGGKRRLNHQIRI